MTAISQNGSDTRAKVKYRENKLKHRIEKLKVLMLA
jgi:hypothetical protein